MIPGESSPKDAAGISEILELTHSITSSESGNPLIHTLLSAYCVWDCLDLHHSDEAQTSRSVSVTDSKMSMRLILPKCYEVHGDQLGQC